jgi:hypothetical protein
MEHPLIGSLDLLTTDELNDKINELSGKLRIAQNTGNAHLCDQIRMAIESYKSKYQDKLQEAYQKQMASSKTNFDDKIKIR